MRRRCAACGLDLEPEVGYYTGAMVVGYTLTIPLLGLLALLVWLATRWEFVWALLAATGLELLVVAVPLYRYARAIWLYLDWAMNPGSFR